MNLMVYLDFVLGVVSQMFSSVMDQGSLITVTWDHAVNSKAKLQSALTSDSKMIEADVIMGHLIDEPDVGKKTDRIPIMGHPPAVTSDLSLAEFLRAFNKTNKILKLDFKSTEAFMLAVPVMENAFRDIPQDRMPWLNADILPGPGPGGNPGMDANTFLKESARSFPDSILSLGWTTKRSDYGEYSENYINDMLDTLFKTKHMKPVTYAVRAAFAVNSINELQYLLETSPVGSTLTIWCSDAADEIDYSKLTRLINTVGANRAYLDLPNDKSETFFDAYAAAGSGAAVRPGVRVGILSLVLLASLYAITEIFY